MGPDALEGTALPAEGGVDVRRPAVGLGSRLRDGLRWIAAPLAVGIAFVVLLQVVYELEIVNPIILPSPGVIGAEIWDAAFRPYMWTNLWVTTQEAYWGFAIASVIGIGLGALIGLSKWTSHALYPYVIFIQSMPRIALVPVFIALLGFGMETKIVSAVALAFFPPLVNTIVGLREVDEDAVTLMRSLSATRFQIFRKLLWPSALPAIFAGLKTALTLSFLGAFVGELVAANAGAGLLLQVAAMELRMDALFAYLFWFSIVALASFGVLEIVDKKVVFWKEEVRRDVFGEE
jgi:NitT/TauT family transport system permease protein